MRLHHKDTESTKVGAKSHLSLGLRFAPPLGSAPLRPISLRVNSCPFAFPIRVHSRFLFASIRVSYSRPFAFPIRVHSRSLFASIRVPYSRPSAVVIRGCYWAPSIAKLSTYFDDCCCNGLSFWNSGEERHRSASARLGNSITTTR
jgi:hypothetical protein